MKKVWTNFLTKLRFWKKPKYFDFERHRKPAVVLHDFISAITTALIGGINLLGLGGAVSIGVIEGVVNYLLLVWEGGKG